MGIVKNIVGAIGNVFQLGKGGPKLKNNSGVIEGRNAGDSAFAIIRGGTPAGNDDLVTKSYADTNYSEGGIALNVIRIPIALINASSTATIPANAYIYKSVVKITTLYDGTPTVTVGYTGGSDVLQVAGDNDPTIVDEYIKEEEIQWDSSAKVVNVTVGGAPTVGAGVVYVFYAESAT